MDRTIAIPQEINILILLLFTNTLYSTANRGKTLQIALEITQSNTCAAFRGETTAKGLGTYEPCKRWPLRRSPPSSDEMLQAYIQ